ncbi:small ribosomal subunit protein S13, mitochondrial-like isoform X3 [Cucumis sativus]|uniref:small ribosomal subunit protein S13, mitochondrial isoform X2 n=1 Tax=Cucumis sativus TaxID=3659 RepID=UPI0005EC7E59|nr:small ribosomal subunit protein S13, mitochondrial isoform X2 [Cucumis sativus]XP_031741500.1 small ribosomal subunit protein S13, mitochondrial-like isoform X3 [Cucumis sativus]
MFGVRRSLGIVSNALLPRFESLSIQSIHLGADEISKYTVGHELDKCVQRDIGRLQDIQCHRGIRHEQGLPCRGQRTKTNARTVKSKQTRVGKRKAFH